MNNLLNFVLATDSNSRSIDNSDEIEKLKVEIEELKTLVKILINDINELKNND